MRQMASPGTGKQLRRKDLEPEELFVIIDPLAYGFITMKQTRRIVSTMGLDLRASQVNKLLYYAPCLDKTDSHNSIVTAYMRESALHHLLKIGPKATKTPGSGIETG